MTVEPNAINQKASSLVDFLRENLCDWILSHDDSLDDLEAATKEVVKKFVEEITDPYFMEQIMVDVEDG